MAESALAAAAVRLTREVNELRPKRAYEAALSAIATLRPEVDAFFDQVMVMDPDLDVRNRRLHLLWVILVSFSGIADFSEIVTAG